MNRLCVFVCVCVSCFSVYSCTGARSTASSSLLLFTPPCSQLHRCLIGDFVTFVHTSLFTGAQVLDRRLRLHFFCSHLLVCCVVFVVCLCVCVCDLFLFTPCSQVKKCSIGDFVGSYAFLGQAMDKLAQAEPGRLPDPSFAQIRAAVTECACIYIIDTTYFYVYTICIIYIHITYKHYLYTYIYIYTYTHMYN